MRLLLNIKIAIICIALPFVNAKAQTKQHTNDAGMWNTLGVEYQINKKWSAQFGQEFRLKENYQRLQLFFNTYGVEYKINKKWKCGISYRNTQRLQENNSFSIENRLSFDLVFKQRINDFSISYRQKIQTDFNGIAYNYAKDWVSRSKVELGYNLSKKTGLNLSSEWNLQLQDVRRQETNKQWYRNRWIAGIDHSPNKIYKLGCFFMFQKEFNKPAPTYLYNTGITCDIALHEAIKNRKKVQKKKQKAKL